MIGRLWKQGETEARALSFADLWGRDLSSNRVTASGRVVTDESALTLSAVFGAVRILSDGVATLPIEVTRGSGPTTRTATRVPSWVENPSVSLSKIDTMSQIMMSLLFRGNAYIFTTRDELGKVLELVVLDPDKVQVKRVSSRVIYTLDGVAGAMNAYDILHIRGMMLPGTDVGIAPIKYAAETIGLGLAAQEYGASFFGNGAIPAAIVSVPGQLTPEGAELLKSSWNNIHKGSGKSGKLAVMTEGAEFSTLSLAPDEAQFLQTRAFQVPDVARIFGVPPHLLQDASGSTSWGSGLAEQSQNYVTHSLRPWVERIEEAFTWLARSESAASAPGNRLNVSLRMDHLTRGDFASRLAAYGSALDRGIFNLDEVRAWEGLAPIPDGSGQNHRVPLNTGPSNTAGAPDDEPAAEPEAPEEDS